MVSEKTVFQLDQVRKSYSRIEALAGVSLSFFENQTCVLIGPSGCGKSTLLRALIGLVSIDSGKILYQNDDLRSLNLSKFRQKIGYVIQDGGLFPHLNVFQNVSLLADHLKWPTVDIQKRVDELLELTRLERNLLHCYPAQLSGGQRQRVSLMRALMMDPNVILLDEPLGALDPMIRADLQKDLKEIFSNLQKSVILVTHDLVEASYLGHRIVLMKDGRVVQDDSIDGLYKNPADEFVSQFLSAQEVLHG